ncbi:MULTISPECIES: Maf family nucleotide pyrophosphatase [Pedobacter]|uniref:dTTP/UTP pyrophosphatase n=1 Tax=Pedobacter heparinus (strain ATCC 13125 / DSM 2366 / CIP 104194 / JCM 7457 / NBRC 12017 / NCIMB 9290 / NRRL B-14731 / HIM 762-3) TaxID=485917 RepID=C6Y3I1_PEDHD|nr:MULTISPECIES: Maf family nucleotide pyrophosphatase [Pedobacter]ACU05406.1 maf protein [Pedobacter heparinus DSM 2366]MBB5439443.1 septum formation protein [Pedobacter sp. AK017]
MYQQKHPLILASKSPRRQDLMNAMNLNFKVMLKDVDESYPDGLSPAEIAVYIAEKKAAAFEADSVDSIVVTADTIVALQHEILGKPEDEGHAAEMLTKLSGTVHQVYTGVSLSYAGKTQSFYDKTDVFFNVLNSAQIRYYIEHYHPLDKAGAYGIQDWIGLIAVEKLVGSYTNVMGLPTEKLYKALAGF